MKTFPCIILILFTLSLAEKPKNFSELKKKLLENNPSPKRIVVVGPYSEHILKALRSSKDNKFIYPILIGDKKKTQTLAQHLNIDISDMEFKDIQDDDEILKEAIKIIQNKEADILWQGSVKQLKFLQKVLDKKANLLNCPPALTTLIEIPSLKKLVILTGPSFNSKTNLNDKINIVENVLTLSKACDFENPKLAAITANEKSNENNPNKEALSLKNLQEKGGIRDCVIEGPISVYQALDPNVKKDLENLDKKINGDADILLFPGMESAKISYDIFKVGDNKLGNVVVGFKVPVIIDFDDRLEIMENSIIMAGILSNYYEKTKEEGNEPNINLEEIEELLSKRVKGIRH